MLPRWPAFDCTGDVAGRTCDAGPLRALSGRSERMIGVRANREGGEIDGDVVILADGVNLFLATEAGSHAEITPKRKPN